MIADHLTDIDQFDADLWKVADDRFWEKEQTKADVEVFILDEVYNRLPTPPFTLEERILAWTVLCSPGVGILASPQRQPCRHAWYSAGRRR